jgi:hypothetical protein
LVTYKDKAELETKNKEFQTAVAAAGVKLDGNVAKMEVRDAESALLEAGSTAVTGGAIFPCWGGE